MNPDKEMVSHGLLTCLNILDTITNCFNVEISDNLIDKIRDNIFKCEDVQGKPYQEKLYFADSYKLAKTLIVDKHTKPESFANMANSYIGAFKSIRDFAIDQFASKNFNDETGNSSNTFVNYDSYAEFLFSTRFFCIYGLEKTHIFELANNRNAIKKNTTKGYLTSKDIFFYLIITKILFEEYAISPSELLCKLEHLPENIKEGFDVASELIVKEKIHIKYFLLISCFNYMGEYQNLENFVEECFQNTYLSDDVYPEITDFIKCGGIDYKKYEDFIFENCYFYVETPLNKHIFLQL